MGLLILAAGLATAGCSRTHYRTRADEQARDLVLEKSQDPRWPLADFGIEMDPRSRYYNDYDRDYPPMPPDDPAAHEYMHHVDGKRNWDHEKRYGTVPFWEAPCWREYLESYVERNENGEIKLNLADAVELALIHNPNYQEQIETLYLSALDVSTERFRFDTQFFGGETLGFEHLGSERGPRGESNLLTSDANVLMRKRLASAADLLVGFANSTTWQFFGPDTHFTTSVLNFAITQPLLRAGGRAVAMEQLTIAERALLANIRAFHRYREAFYNQVAIGDFATGGPQRRGGFFGGTGLTGFTGQGTAGFGGVGQATGFGRGGFGGGGDAGGGGGAGFAGGGAGQVGGYIGLLQQLQQIRNTEDSLGAQLRTLALLEANLEAGLIDIAQVDQFRQSIETERANLLQAQNSLANALDQFKSTTLGLPPDLEFALDDSLIRPFQLIDPRMTAIQNTLASYIAQFGELPLEPSIEQLRQAFDQVRQLRGRTADLFPIVAGDLRRVEATADEREAGMTPVERSAFRADLRRLDRDLKELRERLEETDKQVQTLQRGLTPATRRKTADGIVGLLTDLSNIGNELSLIQARARLETITIQPIELESQTALQIARANRLDWMNNRASLVDSWRLIEFNANALKSVLDIELSGDLQTLGGDNPLKFRDETGRLQARLIFDAPLTRLIERNNFRQQLINYEQARRQYIQFEDSVHRNLRQLLRDLEQLQTNLEIQRRAVAIAIRRVDQTRENLAQPVPPVEPGQPPPQFGPTAALNLLTALSDLRSSQNNLMSVWLNYYATRLRLLREMGIMQIDENGMWVDVPLDELLESIHSAEGGAVVCPLPPAVPPDVMREIELLEDKAPPPPPAPAGADGRESKGEPAGAARVEGQSHPPPPIHQTGGTHGSDPDAASVRVASAGHFDVPAANGASSPSRPVETAAARNRPRLTGRLRNLLDWLRQRPDESREHEESAAQSLSPRANAARLQFPARPPVAD